MATKEEIKEFVERNKRRKEANRKSELRAKIASNEWRRKNVGISPDYCWGGSES